MAAREMLLARGTLTRDEVHTLIGAVLAAPAADG
jgi:hypothetical protein